MLHMHTTQIRNIPMTVKTRSHINPEKAFTAAKQGRGKTMFSWEKAE